MQNSVGTTLAVVEIPTILKRKVGSGIHSATLSIQISNGTVQAVDEFSPVLASPSDAQASFACKGSAVVAAVAALAGMSTSTVNSSGFAAVPAAFDAAIVTPPAVPTESAGVPALIGAGWAKA